nr:TonB-dependent receptor [uncultured Undibacterium sp.]
MKTTFKPSTLALALVAVFPTFSTTAWGQNHDLAEASTRKSTESVERITIKGDRPTSLPVEIPTTIEGINAKTIETTINAIDAEDALKYLPSLLVRKRYVGDYNHAVLATRASGTGNSARSLVYADGILLSNLLGNGANFTPRWGLVTPEEIQRVDVLYGPFSAAYSGNSVGAVVDYVTRMPSKFEAHVKLLGFTENFNSSGTDKNYSGKQLSSSLGNKQGAVSWWINLNRLDSNGHPIVFANKIISSGTNSSAGKPVTGAILGKNPQGMDWWLIGASGQYHTVQDHAKIKLAYDISPTLRASYTYAVWRNEMNSSVQSYLRDSSGNAVYSGDVNIAGKKYTVNSTDISNSKNQLAHSTHGLNLKSFSKGTFDWEVAASVYDYSRDLVRAPTVAIPAANIGGAGRISNGNGTGWNTLALKAIWRPNPQHTGEFGYQREAYQLRTLVSDTSNWILGNPEKRNSAFQGNTQLHSIYAQDAWRMNPQVKVILGGRLEQWSADQGAISNASSTLTLGKRSETHFSPKAALSFRAEDDLMLKASIGRAVRMPTVSELYQGSISTQAIINNNPNLKPEKSWTSEWSAEYSLANGEGLLRSTLFHENTEDALYSQINTLVTPTITNIQNLDKIRTTGLEIAYQGSNVIMPGLDLAASLTYANSKIIKNDKFPLSVGKWQPRVPQWRANFVASYRHNEKLNTSLGIRYSGRQYGSLDNSDHNGFTYMGVSSFLVADLRVRYKVDKQWTAAVGIDNLNNKKYWAFHPYTQRSLIAELKFDF